MEEPSVKDEESRSKIVPSEIENQAVPSQGETGVATPAVSVK